MNDALNHRGPDGEGTWRRRNVAFGHRRLTIIDLTSTGDQPMTAAGDDVVITYNGEIYNYVEQRGELEKLGHAFSGTSDTEVLLRAYLQWGHDLLPRLNGMFAFAIYDFRSDSLFLARDAVGQKPLFYSQVDGSLIFASELSALLRHQDVKRTLDVEAVAEFLVLEYIPAPHSLVAGVRKLEPGFALTFDARTGEIFSWRHWEPAATHPPAEDDRDPEEILRGYEAVMRRSVERHLRSDVPCGLYLSAGLDSTTLAVLAADLVGGDAVNTYTVRIDNKSYDEADSAAATAKLLGTRHHETTLSSADGVRGVQNVLDKVDEPLADLGLYSVYQAARFAADHVKVILSGDGGDEFFYGYEPFLKWHLSETLDRFPPWIVKNGVQRLLGVLPAQFGYMGLLYKADIFLRGYRRPTALRNLAWTGAYQPCEAKSVLRHGGQLANLNGVETSQGSVFDTALQAYERSKDWQALDRLGHEFQSTYLPFCICAHSDKASMMVSLEARSPFLDIEVMKFANSIGHRFKVRDGRGKWIMRRYLASRFPDHHVHGLRKRGYSVPVAHWLRTDKSFQAFAKDLLSGENIASTSILDPAAVQALLKEHLDGRRNNYKKLWPIIVLQSWLLREGLAA